MKKKSKIEGEISIPLGHDKKKLENQKIKSPVGTSVKVDGRTSIMINIPEELTGKERQDFIELKIEKFKERLKTKIETFNPRPKL